MNYFKIPLDHNIFKILKPKMLTLLYKKNMAERFVPFSCGLQTLNLYQYTRNFYTRYKSET